METVWIQIPALIQSWVLPQSKFTSAEQGGRYGWRLCALIPPCITVSRWGANVFGVWALMLPSLGSFIT
jgi:hypothetical protein